MKMSVEMNMGRYEGVWEVGWEKGRGEDMHLCLPVPLYAVGPACPPLCSGACLSPF